jgi:sugar O-acyltransferase (sialic acid O-acetyltransferase NeuD family)
MKKIIIIGCGGLANSCIEIIEQLPSFKIYGLICKSKKKMIGEYKVLGDDNSIKQIIKKCKNAFIAIGQIKSFKTRRKIFKLLKNEGFKLPKVISKTAYVSKHSQIGEGSIIMNKVFINRNVLVGNNTIINTGAIIEHDTKIGSNCHISTGTIINGGVTIADGTFIGSGTVINENIKIGKNCIISSQSKIKKNLKSNLTIK